MKKKYSKWEAEKKRTKNDVVSKTFNECHSSTTLRRSDGGFAFGQRHFRSDWLEAGGSKLLGLPAHSRLGPKPRSGNRHFLARLEESLRHQIPQIGGFHR